MDLLDIRIRADTSGADKATAALDKTANAAGRTGRATDSLAQTFRSLAPLVGTVMAAFSVRALREYADGWSDMQSRVGAAVKDMEAAPALMERLVEVANASYSPLNQTVEIYGRNVSVLSELGYNAQQAADFTESLNHMLVLTATRGERAASVQNALAKAMAVGKLQADGLETILANGGEVAQALANELGTTVNGLRAMASQGKITGDVIARSIVKPLEDVRERAGEMPATIQDAMVRLDTNFGALVGRLDQATGASEGFAQTLIGLADSIRAGTDDIIRAALVIQTGFNAALEWASNAVTALAGDFDSATGVMIAGAGAAGFAVTALATAITGTLIRAVAALGVAMAANPFSLFIAGVSAAVTAVYLFRDEIAEIVGVDVFGVIKDTANNIMNAMIGAFRAVVAIWDQLPSQFDRIGKLAWNALMDGLSGDIITIDAFGKQFSFGIDLSDFKNKLDDAESYAMGVATAAYHAEQGIDRIGQAADALGETWRSVDVGTTSFDALTTSAGKAGQTIDEKATKAAKKLAEAYKQIVDDGQNFVRQQQLEATLIGMSEQAANALRYEFDLLNEALRAGITLTDADRAGFKALSEAMAEAEERTRSLTERFEFMKDLTKGFFNDFRQDLIKNMSEGMSFWESTWRAMGNAAVNALNKIVDKLMNDVLNALFEVNKAGSGGGGGGLLGFLGNLFGLGGGGFKPGGLANGGLSGLWANGGAFGPAGVTPFALGGAFTNSIVNRPTLFPFANGTGLMGEAGPEAIMPLKRGPSGRLGVEVYNGAANQNHANQNAPRGDVHIHINGSGLSQEQLTAAIADALVQYDDGLAPKVEAKVRTMQHDPRAADGRW